MTPKEELIRILLVVTHAAIARSRLERPSNQGEIVLQRKAKGSL